MQEETPTEFVPEPYTSDQPTTIERWEKDELVAFSYLQKVKLWDVLGEDVTEGVDVAAFSGNIEPARCLPMGFREYHSDMGWLCETWTILDPIPSVCARPGDTLYHCPDGLTGRRSTGRDAWPSEWADEVALFDLITDSGGRMPGEGEEVAP